MLLTGKSFNIMVTILLFFFFNHVLDIYFQVSFLETQISVRMNTVDLLKIEHDFVWR